MSGVYINMEMPKSCDDCDLMTVEGEYGEPTCPFGRIIRCASERHPDCPLIPVPPHGRLIDADKEKFKIKRTLSSEFLMRQSWGIDTISLECAFRILSDAPTIIPADPAEEGEG